MHSSSQHLSRENAIKRCPICDRQFGLIRRYSWRTSLCSRSCVDRFNARREADRKWLSWPVLPSRLNRSLHCMEGAT
jgi:hypothetical protein